MVTFVPKIIKLMKKEFEVVYHNFEKNHFWFKSRRRYILQILKEVPKNVKILDIGCSSGILLDELADIGFKKENLYGVDISSEAIDNCKEKGLQNCFVMNAENITLNKKMDIVIASDCLEHLQDDEKALNNWYHLLKPNGMMLIFVPAFMSLWSEHDEVNMHFRRYTKDELTRKIIQAGFTINKSSYWNFLLFIPIFTMRFLNRFKKSRPSQNKGDLEKTRFNELLFTLINFENKLLKYFNFPFGVSAFCIVTKTA